ncbi:Uncharacterized protein DBV15_08496, partial [Temnothorax longispinosus]
MRVQKGDAEKCACGANGGECNAIRAEPAAECSSEPNSEYLGDTGGHRTNILLNSKVTRVHARECKQPECLSTRRNRKLLGEHASSAALRAPSGATAQEIRVKRFAMEEGARGRLERRKKHQLQLKRISFCKNRNGNAHSTSVGCSSRVVHARERVHAAYSSEASRADPELVPGVNTCTLNNREFLAIIECRAGPGGFRCALPRRALTLLVSPLITRKPPPPTPPHSREIIAYCGKLSDLPPANAGCLGIRIVEERPREEAGWNSGPIMRNRDVEKPFA